MNYKDSVIITSVSRSLDILQYLHKKKTETSLTEIASDLGLYKSTVFRMLSTLEAKGFVEQNKETGKYALGIKLFIIGASLNNHWELIKFIKPFTHQLNKTFNETVNVSILSKNADHLYQSAIIYQETSVRAVSANSGISVGAYRDCYCCAVGKCLLAFSENVDLSAYTDASFKKATEKTISSVSMLNDDLKKIKQQGYAIDDEEGEKDLFCIGIPIISGDVAIAAMSLSGPKNRMKDDTLPKKIEYMLGLKREIAHALT